jgi:hypothetical protein
MEEFKTLEEYPGYQFGNLGTILKPDGTEKAYSLVNGYRRVSIGGRFKMAHRLICKAWLTNPGNKPCIDHINRIRHDNRIDNLRWATPMENANNMSLSKANKSGIQGLSFDTRDKLWTVSKFIMGDRYKKHFKDRTTAEAFLRRVKGFTIDFV